MDRRTVRPARRLAGPSRADRGDRRKSRPPVDRPDGRRASSRPGRETPTAAGPGSPRSPSRPCCGLVTAPAAPDPVAGGHAPVPARPSSGRGGRIISWEGLEYEQPRRRPVQLVPGDDPRPRGVDAMIFRDGELDLGAAVYRSRPARRASDVDGGGEPSADPGRPHRRRPGDPQDLHLRRRQLRDRRGPGPGRRRTAGRQRAPWTCWARPEVVRFGWNQGIAPTERVQQMEQPALRVVRQGRARSSSYKKRDGPEEERGEGGGAVTRVGALRRSAEPLLHRRRHRAPGARGRRSRATIRSERRPGTDGQSWAIDVARAPRRRRDDIAVRRASTSTSAPRRPICCRPTAKAWKRPWTWAGS